MTCRTDSESSCAMQLTYNGQLGSIIPNCISKCPLECNSTEITYKLNSQASSGVGYVDSIIENPAISYDFDSTPITVETASNKFVQLFIHYDSLKHTSSTDTPSMDIVTLLSNIGGTLGLFLGISALSVCELLHVLVEIFLLSKKRFEDRKTNSVT
jgi:amiloride-sensitive sodium channel subunit alpha/amiloride-sensitive sodium channel subunit gamma